MFAITPDAAKKLRRRDRCGKRACRLDREVFQTTGARIAQSSPPVMPIPRGGRLIGLYADGALQLCCKFAPELTRDIVQPQETIRRSVAISSHQGARRHRRM